MIIKWFLKVIYSRLFKANLIFILPGRIPNEPKPIPKSSKMSLSVDDNNFKNILNLLGITDFGGVRELQLKVENTNQSGASSEGNCRNVTRILGNFIISFVKRLAKGKELFSNSSEILFKVSRKMGSFRYDENYHTWREKLTFKKFHDWLQDAIEAQRIGCLKRFRQIFSLSFVEEQSFDARHFCIVLKRITKHVLLNEFTRYLFRNSLNDKNKQDWKNAAKYIAMLPKFVRAIKQPNLLYNLKDR